MRCRLSYYYFRFLKTDVQHIGIFYLNSTSSFHFDLFIVIGIARLLMDMDIHGPWIYLWISMCKYQT